MPEVLALLARRVVADLLFRARGQCWPYVH
jgi:hypothetical protein